MWNPIRGLLDWFAGRRMRELSNVEVKDRCESFMKDVIVLRNLVGSGPQRKSDLRRSEAGMRIWRRECDRRNIQLTVKVEE